MMDTINLQQWEVPPGVKNIMSLVMPSPGGASQFLGAGCLSYLSGVQIQGFGTA